MGYMLNPAKWGHIMPVPAEVVENHIKLCSGVALKCLLVFLHSPETNCTNEAIANRLSLPQSEVADALNYWIESGFLLNSDDKILSTATAEAEVTAKAATQQTALPAPHCATTQTAVPTQNAISPSRPHFPREEAVEMINSDINLSALCKELQEILAKPLTSADIDVLLALYSYYNLSAHFILTLAHFCACMGHRRMGYIEKTAVTWLEAGVDDSLVDSHVDMLMKRKGNEGKIKEAFGIIGRALTSKEQEYIAKWFSQFGFGTEIIMQAYEIGVERTGKLAFGYIDKILSDWKQKGFKTIEDVKSEQKPDKSFNFSGNKPVVTAQKKTELDKSIFKQFIKS